MLMAEAIPGARLVYIASKRFLLPEKDSLRFSGGEGWRQRYRAGAAASVNAPPAKSKLIFHRHGNPYFLIQVWSAGSSQGCEPPKSAKEKEQALAARNETPDQVTIVARLISPKPYKWNCIQLSVVPDRCGTKGSRTSAAHPLSPPAETGLAA